VIVIEPQNVARITAIEMYKVTELSPLLSNVVGWLGPTGFIKSNTLSLIERRNDLPGYHVKYAYVDWIGYNPLVNGTLTGTVNNLIVSCLHHNLVFLTGFLFWYLAKKMNMTYTSISSVDHPLGSCDPMRDTFNGLVGMLRRGEAEDAPPSLTITAERAVECNFARGVLSLPRRHVDIFFLA
jgi:hypothetical protein